MASWDQSRFHIRTSGRRTLRRCLRKWGYQSSMRENLQRQGSETNIHFWFGTAIHFAMEDYFGHNKFGDPRLAYKAYYRAFPESERPGGADAHYELGLAMLTYFLEWYDKHNKGFDFQTLWLTENNMEALPGTSGARPAVEETFTLDLGIRVLTEVRSGKIIREYVDDAHANADIVYVGDKMYWANNEVVIMPVCYHGTMDRVVVDNLGRWWILDYKTAKGADTRKLDTDDQISSYMWAAEQWYQHEIYGFIYLQLTKEVAKPPRMLQNGHVSTDKKQKTSHALYRQALIERYGSVQKAPAAAIQALNIFAEKESPEGDRFIRWDMLTRNAAQKISTYNNIMAETRMMVQPDLYLFPNPTRDCGWDCPFRELCLAEDRGDTDLASQIRHLEFEVRSAGDETNHDEWKSKIIWPDEDGNIPDDDGLLVPEDIFSIELPDCYLSDEDKEYSSRED